MFMTSEFRGQGLGRKILKHLEVEMNEINKPFYLIGKPNLTDFYGFIEFKEIEALNGPAFLQKRISDYRSKGFDVILMKRTIPL